MLDLENKEQLIKILSTFPVVVVYAWRPSCEPCKYLEPKLRNVETILNNGHLMFVKESVNVMYHKPEGYPSVYFYIKGSLYHTTLGADYPEIIKKIAELYGQMNWLITEEQKQMLKDPRDVSNPNNKLGLTRPVRNSDNTSMPERAPERAPDPQPTTSKPFYGYRKGTSRYNYASSGNLGKQ